MTTIYGTACPKCGQPCSAVDTATGTKLGRHVGCGLTFIERAKTLAGEALAAVKTEAAKVESAIAPAVKSAETAAAPVIATAAGELAKLRADLPSLSAELERHVRAALAQILSDLAADCANGAKL